MFKPKQNKITFVDLCFCRCSGFRCGGKRSASTIYAA